MCATWSAGARELARDERLFRFVFPERPGALMRFLAAMHPGWNISLFHYRNQGADYGRILVGIQVPAADEAAFQDFLRHRWPTLASKRPTTRCTGCSCAERRHTPARDATWPAAR